MLKGLHELIPEVYKIRNENRVHLIRLDGNNNDLVKTKRPTEDPKIQQWRIDNYRLINHEIYETYLRQIRKLLMDEVLVCENGSPQTNEWLKANSYALVNFYNESVLFQSLLDANSVTVILPKKVSEENINKFAELQWYNVPSDRIFYKNERFYIRSEKKIKIGNKEEYTFYSFNENNIYFHYYNNSNDLVSELYFEHNLGFLPFINMPSELCINSNGQRYREPSFKTTTGYLNEFVCNFSDSQFMWLKNNYQTFVTPPINCSECKGEGIIIDTKENKRESCSKCSGTGKQRAPGLSEYVVLPAVNYDDKLDTRVPFYLAPDTSSLIFSKDTTFELLDKAAATLGINPLIKTSESGEAMKERLKKWEDTANYSYNKYVEYFNSLCEIVEGYLNFEPLNRVKNPKINRIDNIMYKDVNYLRDSVKNALPFEKKQANIEYINRKYNNNPVMRRIYNLIALYYPVLLMNEEELKNGVAFSRVSEDTIKEAQEYESKILIRAKKDSDFILNASDEQLLSI